MREFFAMGGYAVYIWPCYIACFGLLLWHIWQAIVTQRKVLRKITQEHIRKARNELHS